MSQTITAGPYNAYQSQAMIGMKADSMEDNVDTFAAAAPIPFGVVVSRVAPADMKVQAGGAAAFVGISIHDHIIGSRATYIQYDAVSVLTRGRVWAKVSDATGVADGAMVHYDPATGQVNRSGTKLLNAVFRSAAVSLPDVNQVVWGDGTTTLGAIVELHYPFVDQTSTVAGGMSGQEIGPTEETQKYFDAVQAARQEREDRREEERRRDEELQRQNEESNANQSRTRADYEAEARRNESGK